jgi:hypothetical protein
LYVPPSQQLHDCDSIMTGSPASPRQSQQTASPSHRPSIPLRDLGSQQSQPQHESREPGSLADRNLPTISTYWEGSQFQHEHHNDYDLSPNSPFDASALQFALPPDIHPPQPMLPDQLLTPRIPTELRLPTMRKPLKMIISILTVPPSPRPLSLSPVRL